jgi:hypothetical protein
MTLISRIVAALPVAFLPNANKCVADQSGGKHIPLSVEERRVYLTDNIVSHANLWLDKYSPLRKLAKLRQNIRRYFLYKRFYGLIGIIALEHAAIEQDIKNCLLRDWKLPNDFRELRDNKTKPLNIEKLYGYKLPEFFMTRMKEHFLPQHFLGRYEAIFLEFGELSLARNDIIKRIYFFNTSKSALARLELGWPTTKPYLDFEYVDFGELVLLGDRLKKLRIALYELEWEIMRDKHEVFIKVFPPTIGSVVPADSLASPYRYQIYTQQACESELGTESKATLTTPPV